MKILKTILVIAILITPVFSQWHFAGISDDGVVRVEYYDQFTYYRDGDVEVWIKTSAPYYGRWRETARVLVRFDCVTYSTFLREFRFPSGRNILVGRNSGKAHERTLFRAVAIDICDANSR